MSCSKLSCDEFFQQATSFLEKIMGELDKIQILDYDDSPESLTVVLPDQRVYLFNIHQPLSQLWVSSPFSGGRHFSYLAPHWTDTRNGEQLSAVLKKEWGVFFHLQLD